MKLLRHFGLFLLACLLGVMPLHAAGEEVAGEKSTVDVQEIVFGHIRDAYEWHLFTLGEKHVSIPLPVIVYSQTTGWHAFSSSRLGHGAEYEGLHIASEGSYAGKVVETTPDGQEVRPLDISITKTALSLMINSLLLVLIIVGVARWYKNRKPSSEAPKGFVGFMEMFVMMIHDDVIVSCVGKDYKRYAPYLLTAFFFIFINNLMGLVPIFPGGGNVTGNIAITLFLALMTFLAVNIFGTKEYWKEIFWPDVPTWLKVPVPFMPVIELFGVFTKPFALTVRLFANIMAGHAIILSLVSIIFITASLGAVLSTSMTIVSVLFSIFMSCLEILVAFIQAYVFTMLSAVFIGLSRVRHEEHA